MWGCERAGGGRVPPLMWLPVKADQNGGVRRGGGAGAGENASGWVSGLAVWTGWGGVERRDIWKQFWYFYFF